MANFALASVYRRENRNKDAIELYKKIVDKPTRTVSRATAQLELATTYQADNQPLEAEASLSGSTEAESHQRSFPTCHPEA